MIKRYNFEDFCIDDYREAREDDDNIQDLFFNRNKGSGVELLKITGIYIPPKCDFVPRMSRCFLSSVICLENFEVDKDNEKFASFDGCVYSKDKKVFYKYPPEKKNETFVIDGTVEEIADFSFDYAPLKNIYIGANVKKIGPQAFSYNSHIERVFVASEVLEIENEIFYSCPYTYKYSVIVGGKKGSSMERHCNEKGIPYVYVEENEVEAFFAASNEELYTRIEEQIDSEENIIIEVPSSGYQLMICGGGMRIDALPGLEGKEISIDCFYQKISPARRKRIKKLCIGEGITTLSNNSCLGFDNLVGVYIGSNVSKIETRFFASASNLSCVEVCERNTNYRAINSVLYSYDLKRLIMYPQGKEERFFEIPNHVEIIATRSFVNVQNLKCVKIGTSVLKIYRKAFTGCSSIRKIYCDGNTKIIDRKAFNVEIDYCDDPEFLIIGGKLGTKIENHCEKEKIDFQVVEDKDIYKFLSTDSGFWHSTDAPYNRSEVLFNIKRYDDFGKCLPPRTENSLF